MRPRSDKALLLAATELFEGKAQPTNMRAGCL